MKLLNRQHIKEYYKENVAMAKRDSMKKQIKSFIVAAQGQALWTNYRMERIAKTNDITTCIFCKENDETVSHMISECSKVTQRVAFLLIDLKVKAKYISSIKIKLAALQLLKI